MSAIAPKRRPHTQMSSVGHRHRNIEHTKPKKKYHPPYGRSAHCTRPQPTDTALTAPIIELIVDNVELTVHRHYVQLSPARSPATPLFNIVFPAPLLAVTPPFLAVTDPSRRCRRLLSPSSPASAIGFVRIRQLGITPSRQPSFATMHVPLVLSTATPPPLWPALPPRHLWAGKPSTTTSPLPTSLLRDNYECAHTQATTAMARYLTSPSRALKATVWDHRVAKYMTGVAHRETCPLIRALQPAAPQLERIAGHDQSERRAHLRRRVDERTAQRNAPTSRPPPAAAEPHDLRLTLLPPSMYEASFTRPNERVRDKLSPAITSAPAPERELEQTTRATTSSGITTTPAPQRELDRRGDTANTGPEQTPTPPRRAASDSAATPRENESPDTGHLSQLHALSKACSSAIRSRR
ncbi:hypothetical protein DFH06DRAFT_1152045 [Mycena polygramma]|nr:hypothetical protein DFH06DRAFT_1152045 [Mycena polygramma]